MVWPFNIYDKTISLAPIQNIDIQKILAGFDKTDLYLSKPKTKK